MVSKRIDKPYVSGPTRYFVKSKCPDWVRDNTHRYKLFEGSKKPQVPVLTERQRVLRKKWEELAHLRDRLDAGGLRASLKAALEAQAAVILEEIKELEAE